MRWIEPDRHEIAGTLRPATIAAAQAAMAEDGLVGLAGVVPVGAIDCLAAKLIDDTRAVQQAGALDNNYQGVRPPPFHPWLFRDIVFNEAVIAVSRAVLGNPALATYGANTAFCGSRPQQIHLDGGVLWAGQQHPHPCVSLVVNIPLVDVDERNGATIVYPGTHRDLRFAGDDRFPGPEQIAQRASERAPERVCSRRGDLVLRDVRLWHGGMPNTTDQPRPMLAMVHNARWMRGWFEAEAGSELFWRHPGLIARAVFVPAPIDYLRQGHSAPRLP